MDGPSFRHSFAGLRSTRPRTERVRKIVLHTTGGIRPPAGVYDTLRKRKGPRTPDGLSIHYVVGIDGEVVQMAPHSLVCLHAGPANGDSVGIEVVSPLLATTEIAAKERARGVQRREYIDRVRGKRRVRLLDMTDAQTDALLVHVEWLCDVLRVPRVVPTEGGELMRREMTLAELDAYEGVIGHFQIPTSPTVKLDPGTSFLDTLRQRWLRE